MKLAPNHTIEKFQGIGTYWWVEIFDEDFDPMRIDTFVKDTMATFEANYSRFKEDSLLSQLNTNRVLEKPSGEMLELLFTGVCFYTESKGVFNFAMGKTLSDRGYDAKYSFTSKQQENTSPAPDLKQVLSIDTQKIELLDPDVHIDFGGFGKGFLIDKLAKGLHKELGLKYFLINGGGDMYVTSERGEPFELYLEHPTHEGEYLHKIYLEDKAFCSSSPYKRRWKDRATGEIKTHILNPDDIDAQISTAAFTVAKTAAEADAYATVATIIGHDQERTAEILPDAGIAYVLVQDEHTIIRSPDFPKFYE